MAEGDKIIKYRPAVDVILNTLGHPEALVTNESCVSDFRPDDETLARLIRKIGFDVSKKDYIWEIAMRYNSRKIRH
jgi:hypothetical protein